MSVDTHLVGKRIDRYKVITHQDVEFLIPGKLERWDGELRVDARRSVLGSKKFIIDAIHAHAPG